ncbi:MAG: serine/threonine-protein kinase [Myxococcota bacterium]
MAVYLGGFELESRVGVGGMGEVWRARSPAGVRVAVKVVREGAFERPHLRRLIEGEIRALARLDHPNIAWIYDHGRVPPGTPFAEGAPYLVLEHCGDGTLADRVPTSWSEVRPIVVGLLGALAHAHAHGIVHRDLKPENVLWSRPSDARPGMKLADFGIAHWLEDGEHTGPGGTPWYMAPEQVDPAIGALGPWTDLYSLGVVVWECVTGRVPWTYAAPQEVVVAAAAGLPRLVPRFSVPPGLGSWLATLLDPDPQHRTRHAMGALRALAELDREVAVVEPTWRDPERNTPRLQMTHAGLGVAAVREPPLVGRDAERQELWERLPRSGRGARVVVIRGVSGIGKSRLARWLTERVTELGVAAAGWVGCREGQVGLRMFTALGGELPDAVARSMQEGRRWGASSSVREAWDARIAQPTVVVVDDVQHSPDAVAFGLQLATEPGGAPVLLVLTVEDGAIEGDPELAQQLELLSARPGVTTLRLGPLDGVDQEDLLRRLLTLDPEAESDLLACADGHPGTVVAQVTSWIRLGAIAPTPRGYRPAEPARADWSEVWAEWLIAWLAPLSDADRFLLERAAASGRVVDESLWDAACDDPEATTGPDRVQVDRAAARRRAQLVDRLIAAGLAYETDFGFTFAHPSLVELLERSATERGRWGVHHRAWAAQLQARGDPDLAMALGRHLLGAGDPDGAATVWLTALSHRWNRQDRRPMLAELERARSAALAAGWAANDVRWSDVHTLRALLLLNRSRMTEAVAEAERGLDIACEHRDRPRIARAAIRLVDVITLSHRWEALDRVVKLYLEVERDPGQRAHWPGLVRMRQGRALDIRGDAAGAERWYAEAERAYAAARRAYPDDERVVGGLVELYGHRDDHQGVMALGPEAERMGREAGNLEIERFAVSKALEAAIHLERWEEARGHGRRALLLHERLGDQRFAGFLCLQLGGLEIRAGQYGEARAWIARAEELGEDYPWHEMMVHLLRSVCALNAGELSVYDAEIDEIERQLPRLDNPEPMLVADLREQADQLRALGQSARSERALAVAACAEQTAGRRR